MVKHYLPTTLEDTLNILATEDVEILAGGTDLMVQRRKWANTKPRFASTINIINVSELRYIQSDGIHLTIGATTRYSDLLGHPDVPELFQQCIELIASPALRNIATIAGNIGNASPAGDTLPVLYLYDAMVELQSKNQTRHVPIQDVIQGPRKTTIMKHELITAILIPLHPFTFVQFDKVGGRKADAISKLSLATAVQLDGDTIIDIRFAFGAVGPVVVRSRELEEQLIGQSRLELEPLIPSIVTTIKSLISPIDDQRSNKHYRMQVAINLVTDILRNL